MKAKSFFLFSFFCLGRRETRPFPLFRRLEDLVFNGRARTHRNATPGACFPLLSSCSRLSPVHPFIFFVPSHHSSVLGGGKKQSQLHLWTEHSSSFTFQSHRIHSVAPPTTEVLNASDPPTPPPPKPTNQPTPKPFGFSFRLQI